MRVDHASDVKKWSSKVCGWICSVWPSWVRESQHISTGNTVSCSLCHSSRSSFHRRSPEHQELRDLNWSAQQSPLLSWQRLSFLSSLSYLGTNFTQIFIIFSSLRIIVCTVPTLTSNCPLIVSIDDPFLWNSLFRQTTLLFRLPYFSHTSHHPSQTPCIPWISYATQKLMLDSCKMVEKQFEALNTFLWHFFQSLKHNFIAYCSSKVSSRPECIFEIHQLWQSGFSRVYSNCCCSCSFEPEIIKISQPCYKMYSNNILNFQDSTTKRYRNNYLIEFSFYMKMD